MRQSKMFSNNLGRIYVLLILVVASCGLWFYKADVSTIQTVRINDAKLFPKLIDKTSQIVSINVITKDRVILNALLKDNQWVTNQLSDAHLFPIDKIRIETLISKLATTRIKSIKTSNSNKYHLLGVERLNSVDSDSVLLTVATNNQQWKLIVGKQSIHQQGTFVRKPDKSTSSLVDTNIGLPLNVKDWLLQPVVNLSKIDIQQIEITNNKTALFTQTQFNDLSTAAFATLSNITFVDVVEQESALLSWFTQTPIKTIKVITNTNILELSLYKNSESEQVWLKIASNLPMWQTDWAFELSAPSAAGLLAFGDIAS